MTLVRLRKAAQLTLPAAIREALAVEEGDLLEASLVEGGVLLKPVTVVDREAAWERIRAAQAGVRWRGPGAEPSEEEVLKMAAEEVRAIRQEAAAARRRR
jgi:AbrB family looped-hinge helix DNA binding protein